MVLRGLSDGLYLVGREPLCQTRVGADDAAAFQMMRLAFYGKAKVMACRSRIQHVLVNVICLPHCHGAVYDRTGMVFPVRLVKRSVTGNDLGLDVFDK